MKQPLCETGLEAEAFFIIGTGNIWDAHQTNILTLNEHGIAGDRHYGETRIIQPYESEHLAGLEVANDKQVSIVCEQDMRDIAVGLELPVGRIERDAEMPIEVFLAGRLAANILVRGGGLNDAVRPGDLLAFGNSPDNVGGIIRMTEYNEPCRKPAANLVHALEEIDMAPNMDFDPFKELFKQVAEARRGWVASVYKPGILIVENSVYIHNPVAVPEVV